MRKNHVAIAILAISALFSCNKVESTIPVEQEVNSPRTILTKGVDDKSPSILCYVETNDVNPLNAGEYYLPNGKTFIDYVVLFASNIHATTVNGTTQPTVYFNPSLVPIMSGASTYIAPLRAKNQAVLLGVLGDWANLGLSSMTTTQAEQLATILAYVVDTYGLDGVAFDDEYSGTNTIVNGSYSTVITKYRQLRPDDYIHVFDWGGTSSISTTAAAEIDYAGHGYFGYNLSTSYSNITGMNNARWSPISLLLGQSYSSSSLSTIQSWAASAKNNNYGQILLFNLRSSCELSPLPVFQAISDGANWGTVTNNGNCYSKPEDASEGYTITYAMATGN